MLEIKSGHLNTVCEEVENIADKQAYLAQLINGMLSRCYSPDGRKIAAGLAANQIGLPIRVIVLDIHGLICGMINPVIEKYRGGIAKAPEGCLSYPGRTVADVPRHKIIKVSWFDADGSQHRRSFRGDIARVIQHEVDHLDGISMMKRKVLGPALNREIENV